MPLLEGRKALVTGASQGLGAAIAHELTARGAQVLMCSRSSERIHAAAAEISSAVKSHGAAPGVGAWLAPLTISADVSEPDAAPTLAKTAEEAFGRLDVLVCNAGGPPPGEFTTLRDSEWEAAFRLLIMAPVRLIRACLPLLKASQAGRIVIVSSMAALQPVPRLMLSNVLRPALSGLARHLSGELGRDNILINVVAPGFFETERAQEVRLAIAASQKREPEAVLADLRAEVPLGRPGEPEEIGRLVAFLVSAENSYITGQTHPIDGGRSTAP